MARRGYSMDTIRGAASEWDVSRPFSSYARLLFKLLFHPFRFFELLPKIPDPRAPVLFLGFSGIPAALLWFVSGGTIPALLALVSPLPLSVLLSGLYHSGALGGHYGFKGTWRTLAYPLGYYLPLTAVPGLRWVAGVYAGVVLLTIGLSTVQGISITRAALTSITITALVIFALLRLTV